MITNIIDLLNTMDFYGVSKNIDIAKGINSIPTSFGDAKKQIKRKFIFLKYFRKMKNKNNKDKLS